MESIIDQLKEYKKMRPIFLKPRPVAKIIVLCRFWILCLLLSFASNSKAIEALFDRDIRPILSSTCLHCHGPDATTREADLRLDMESTARPVLDEIVQRIFSNDPDELMPPPESGKVLSEEDKYLIKSWVDSGAKWEKHWSLKPLSRPEIPLIDDSLLIWVQNPIDKFIARQHVQVGLKPSQQAGARAIVRRLTYDLIGLPPAPEEVDEFVEQFKVDKDKARMELIEKLLASHHYGERWGRHWLDVVKYADTCGYDKDKLRPNAWPYRDYVIRSFNADKPYARFVNEQIAGDSLYPGSKDGILGLGFIAAGPWDFIGHVEVPESKIDGQIARHIDRDEMVSNTMNTFVSTTVQCARCHDHKFDAIEQKHYYSLQSVFSAVDRAERIYQTDPKVESTKNQLSKEIQDLSDKADAIQNQINEAGGDRLDILKKTITSLESKVKLGQKKPGFGYHSQVSDSEDEIKWVEVDLGRPTEVRRIVLRPAHDDFNGIGSGFGFPRRFTVSVSLDETESSSKLIADFSKSDFENPGLSQVEIKTETRARFIRVSATKLAKRSDDFIFALSELQAFNAASENVARKGKVIAKDSIEAPARWRKINLIDGIFPQPTDPKAQSELTKVRKNYQSFLESIGAPEKLKEIESLNSKISKLKSGLSKLPKGNVVYAAATDFKQQGQFKPTMGKPRTIRVLNRGNILSPQQEVGPGVFPVFEDESVDFDVTKIKEESDRRAALARWITRKDHPLTWRSIVNRIWLWHFGKGLVETPNDFGKMGQPPSHPELLDWLACEFRDSGGSFKHLHRLILTSATYNQSSKENPLMGQIDSDNRFLWRMNRRRLEAEELRDSILSVSGALDKSIGGPGFYLFALEKTDHSPHYEYYKFDPSDPSSHRRSVYRFIVRSQPDPFMTTLDCADSSQSTPKREETLTALQALSLLNNKFSLFMSKRFALRLQEKTSDISKQIQFGFQLVTGRDPDKREHKAMVKYAEKHGLPNLCRVLFNLSEFTYLD